jgi:acyl-CoA synthetase (AMP-forming)/AMP-acid ligase II
MRTTNRVPDTTRPLPELLLWRAQHQPERRAFTFLAGRKLVEQPITYGEIDRRARAIAQTLLERCAPGDRALLLFPAGLDYIAAFFGCQYARVIAVPAYPPDPSRIERTLPRLLSIIEDARVSVILTTDSIKQMSGALAGFAPEVAELDWMAADAVDESRADAWQRPTFELGSTSFLQYTSGSTSRPRGVVIGHDNLVANAATISALAQIEPATDVGVSWLPLYHDMGLIGNMLQQVFDGYPQLLMSPITFLKRPLSWLQVVSDYGATLGNAPNFAFDLCVARTTPEQRAALDLSSLRLVVCGAEPIRPATFERFLDAFAPAGFRAEAFSPCYGLAEATLIVSGGGSMHSISVDPDELEQGRVVESDEGRPIVSCGPVRAALDVAILGPDGGPRCAPGTIGEIAVSGSHVASGYWENPEGTAATFGRTLDDGTSWMLTGDLGFLRDGELYVTGRLKDLIIVGGANHYPHDIETTVEQSHPSFRKGCVAAFGADRDGEEDVIVVAEVREGDDVDAEALRSAARRAVFEGHGLSLSEVVLAARGAVPKTSSGKLQRRATRRDWQAGRIPEWSP